MFQLLKSYRFQPGSRRGSIFIRPADWCKVFPRPSVVYKTMRATDGKVDRIWLFKGGMGKRRPFMVYAYSMTSQYDPGYPAPDDFWKSTEIHGLSINSEYNCREFVDWLKREVLCDVDCRVENDY